jgi:hypothetical protein
MTKKTFPVTRSALPRMFVVALSMTLLCLSATPALASSEDNDAMTYDIIPDLLRLNRAWELVSSDLSSYITWTCTDAKDGDRTCKSNLNEDAFTAALDSSSGSSGKGDIVSYLEGIAMYAAINFAGFIFLVLGTMIYLTWGVFHLCFQPCANPSPVKVHPKKRTYCAYGCLFVSIAFMIVLALIGYSLGGTQLTQGIIEASDTGGSMAEIVKDTVAPVQGMVINVMGLVLSPFVLNAVDLLFKAVDLDDICADLEEIDYLYKDLFVVSLVRNVLDDLQNEEWIVIDNITGAIHELGVVIAAPPRVNATRISLQGQASSVLGKIQGTKDALNNTVVGMSASIAPLTGIRNKTRLITGSSLDSGPSGLVGSSLADLGTLRRDQSDPGGKGYPFENTYQSVVDGSVVSLDSLLVGGTYDLEGNASGIRALNYQLEYIYAQMLLLPDYGETAAELVRTNDTVNALLTSGGLIDQFVAALGVILNLQNSIPSAPELKSDVTYFFGSAFNLSLADLRFAVSNIQPFLDSLSLPLIDIHFRLLDLNITVILPPMRHLMINTTDAVTKNLYNISRFYDFHNGYFRMSDTVLENSGSLVEMADALYEAIVSIQDVNITGHLITIDDITVDLNMTLHSVDQQKLFDLLDDFGTSANGVNASKYLSELGGVSGQLSGISIPFDVVAALEALETQKADTNAALLRAIGSSIQVSGSASVGDLLLLAQGQCSEDSDVYCSSDADCTGTCDSLGVYRCSAKGDGLNSAITPCAADGDCPVGTYCLNDGARTLALKSWMDIWGQSGALDATTAVTDTIDFGDLSFEDTFNMTDAIATINDSIADLRDIDLQEYIDLMADVIDSLNVTATLNDVSDNVGASKEIIQDFDFEDYNHTLQQAEKIVDQLADYFPDIVFACHNFQEWIFGSYGLDDHIAFFQTANLESIAVADGPGGVIKAVTTRIDTAINEIGVIVSNFTDIAISKIGTRKDVDTFSRTMDKMAGFGEYSDNTRHGSLYFITQLYNTSRKETVDAHEDKVYSVDKDSDGKRYSDNRYCVTRECFINFKEETESEPIIAMSGIDTSFSAIVGYVWIFPAIVVLLGIITLMCPLCTAKPGLRRCPATTMLVFTICQLGPFLIITGFFFPFVIFAADSCSSSTRITQDYVTVSCSVCRMSSVTVISYTAKIIMIHVRIASLLNCTDYLYLYLILLCI